MNEALLRDILSALVLPFYGLCGALLWAFLYWVTKRTKAKYRSLIEMYQADTKRTANPQTDLTNCCFGLIGESGEVVDLVKKHIFQGHPMDVIRPKISKELGDAMWYICMLANICGIDMTDVLNENLDKLKKRYPNGFSADKSINRDIKKEGE